MKKVLIVYATNAGSTVDVAQAIGEVFGKNGTQVDVRPINAVTGVNGYDAVVIGAPMIFGWHKDALTFLKQHQNVLSRIPVACLMLALNLTKFAGKQHNGVPIYQDARSAKAPKDPDKLSFKENFASVASYTAPVFENVPQVKPVSIGLFGGKLDYSRLNLFQRLFVRLIIGAEAGDFRNWDALREWAEGLRPALLPGA